MNDAPKLPPPFLPVAYFAYAHASLVAALLLVAIAPEQIAGFFYHGRMFAGVHLITLGWITCSILGAMYLVAPFALRVNPRVTRADYATCASVLVGSSGVVTHFWIETYGGLIVAAVLLFGALAYYSHRVWFMLGESKAAAGIRWIVGLAFANLQLAAIYGMVLALNKIHPVLPGSHFDYVFGHAHLAAVGWAVMMVIGVGYRLLPMFLPAAPLTGRSVLVCAVLLETGVVGFAVGLPLSATVGKLFSLVLVAGLATFFFDVGRMLRQPRQAPPHLPRPDLGMLHAFQSLAYLLISTAIGLYMLFTPGWQLDWIMVYGVFGFLGFLGQIILGMASRLLPMFAWTTALHRSSGLPEGPPPHAMALRSLQVAVLVLWTAGVPTLALGLARDRHAWVAAGGGLLALAAFLAGANFVRIVRRAFPGASAV